MEHHLTLPEEVSQATQAQWRMLITIPWGWCEFSALRVTRA